MNHSIRLSKKYKLLSYIATRNVLNESHSRWQVYAFAYNSRYNCYLRNRYTCSLHTLEKTLYSLARLGDIADQAKLEYLISRRHYKAELSQI